jgi:hypothetical protein
MSGRVGEPRRMEVDRCAMCPFCMGDRLGRSWCAFREGGDWMALPALDAVDARCDLRAAPVLVVLKEAKQ